MKGLITPLLSSFLFCLFFPNSVGFCNWNSTVLACPALESIEQPCVLQFLLFNVSTDLNKYHFLAGASCVEPLHL